jgi:hypothetical protein
MRHTIPTGLVGAAAAALVVASAAAALPERTAGSEEPQILFQWAGAEETGDTMPHATFEFVIAALETPHISFQPPATMPMPTPTPTPKPKPKPKPYVDSVANAKAYARSRLGATQYACLDDIFYYESKWDPLAENPRSGAYGIPQALPGSKMAAFGSNWRTSPLTQVKWGIWYVNDRYGSACAAWDHIEASGWY